MVATTIADRQPRYQACSFKPAIFVPATAKPVAHVRHFDNEASKREYLSIEQDIKANFEAGSITKDQVIERITRAHERLTHLVPVYHGVSTSVYRMLKNEHRRKKKKPIKTLKRSFPS